MFGAGTLLALTLDDANARVVLSIGWVAHAAWDVYHYRRDIVVARWWAEQCAVVDVAIAGFLLWPLVWHYLALFLTDMVARATAPIT